MSEESTNPDLVALTRGLSEAPSVDESLAYYAPDAVYDMSRMGMTTFEGREAIGVFFSDWHGNYDEYEDEIQEIVHVGGGIVFVVVRQNARPAGSPQHVRLRDLYGYTFVWEGDKVVHATVYPDVDEARAAAERLAEDRG